MKISTYVFTRILAYDNFVYIFTNETVMQRTPLKGDQYEVRRQNGFARNENKANPISSCRTNLLTAMTTETNRIDRVSQRRGGRNSPRP
jgi:hypothetical protein